MMNHHHNFDHWLSRRRNEINEGIFDWLWGKKTPAAPPGVAPDPAIKDIYENPTVKQYVNAVLGHMGLKHGVVIQSVGATGGDIKVTDLKRQQPIFYDALQRFVAAHVLGGGYEKSYLRISQHDAVTILNFLDKFKYNGSRHPIMDDLGITNPQDLVDWMQTKIPTAGNAMRQQGFDKVSSSYRRGGKDNPLSNPGVKAIVTTAERVLNNWSGGRVCHAPMQQALRDLHAELTKFTGSIIPGRSKDKTTPTPVPPTKVPGTIVDTDMD